MSARSCAIYKLPFKSKCIYTNCFLLCVFVYTTTCFQLYSRRFYVYAQLRLYQTPKVIRNDVYVNTHCAPSFDLYGSGYGWTIGDLFAKEPPVALKLKHGMTGPTSTNGLCVKRR